MGWDEYDERSLISLGRHLRNVPRATDASPLASGTERGERQGNREVLGMLSLVHVPTASGLCTALGVTMVAAGVLSA